MLLGSPGNLQPQRMRGSQTMPHLHYTKDDIQEQYMPKGSHGNQLIGGQQQKRSQSSGPKKRRLEHRQQSFSGDEDGDENYDGRPNDFNDNDPSGRSKHNNNASSNSNNRLTGGLDNRHPSSSSYNDYADDDDDGDNEHENYSAGARHNKWPGDNESRQENSSRSARSRTRDNGAKSKRKGNKRARSASLFSACFTIPNLSSMLPQSTAAAAATTTNNSSSSTSSARRSILAHLGLNSSRHSQQQQQQQTRPISSSQTAGNLAQVAASDYSGAASAGAAGNQLQNSARKHVSFEGSQRANSMNLQAAGQQAFNEGNNVILRNYQPHNQQQQQHQQAALQMTSPGSSVLGQHHYAASSTSRELAAANNDSPARLRPAGSQATASASTSTFSVGQQPIRQQPSSLMAPKQTTQPATITQQQRQAQAQARASADSNQCPQMMMAAANQQGRNQANATATTTFYKRLPSIPMRTQATQTEITAYHLMAGSATPSFANSNTSSATRTRRQQPGQAQVQQQQQQQRPQQQRPARVATPESPSTSQQQTLLLEQVGARLLAGAETSLGLEEPSAGEGVARGREADQEEEEAEEAAACGNLNASLLASSCSSSSVVSLEGHDSTLANTLQCDLRVALDDEDDLGKKLGAASGKTGARVASRRKRSDGRQAGEQRQSRTSIIDGGDNLAAPMGASERNNENVAIAAASTSSDETIEPPSEFKDITLRTKQPERVESMNKNSTNETTGASNDNKIDLAEPSCDQSEQADVYRQSSRVAGARGDGASLDRAASPPSLSEASSQTDTSMAQHIIDIGRSLDDQQQQQQQHHRGQTSCVTEERDEFAEKIGRLVAETSRRRSQPEKGSRDEEIRGAGGSNNDNDNDYEAAVAAPAANDKLEEEAAPSEVKQRPKLPEGSSLSSSASQSQSQMQTQTQTQASQPRGSKSGASPAEQRRDHFLTLDELELEAAAAATSSTQPAAQANQPAKHQRLSQRPSTSTLSTRHHSYCSSEDFARPAARQQQQQQQSQSRQQRQPQGSLDFDGCQMALEPADLSGIDESPTGPAQDTPMAPASDSQPEGGVEACETSARPATIKRGDSAGHFTISADGGHKAGGQRRETSSPLSSGSSASSSSAAGDKSAPSLATGLSRELLREAELQLLAAAAAETPKSSKSSTSSSSSVSSVNIPSGKATGTAEEAAGEQRRRSSQASGASPPTTVSELLGDDEEPAAGEQQTDGSLGRQVREFAATVVDDLIGELVLPGDAEREEAEEQAAGQHGSAPSICRSGAAAGETDQVGGHHNGLLMRIDGLPAQESTMKLERPEVGVMEDEVQVVASSSSTSRSGSLSAAVSASASASTSAASSTTSASANSYVCCHPAAGDGGGGQATHPTRRQEAESRDRPELPEKPAHLRRRPATEGQPSGARPEAGPDSQEAEEAAAREALGERPEAAAAVAVTATSIAAAAVAARLEQAARSTYTCAPLRPAQPSDAAGGEEPETEADHDEEEEEPNVQHQPDQASRTDPEGRRRSTRATSGDGPALVSRSSSVCSTASVVAASQQQQQQVPEPSWRTSSVSTAPACRPEPSSPVTTTTTTTDSTDQPVTSESRKATLGSEDDNADGGALGEELEHASLLSQEGAPEEEVHPELVAGDDDDADADADEEEEEEEGQLLLLDCEIATETPPPRQSSSQELSTVSEVSEEISTPATRNDSSSLAARRQRASSNSRSNSNSNENSRTASGKQQGMQPPQRQPELINLQLSNAANLEQNTELDLAHSEYTLRSQGSEAAALTLASEVAGPVAVGGAPADSRPPLGRQHSAEQRRRSTGSSGTSSGAGPAVGAVHQAAGSQSSLSVGATVSASGSTRPHGMKSPVDCPYVHDILPLSPQNSDHLLISSSSGGAVARPLQPLLGAIHKRLSHDDTMEAIEDDVEGEEQELQELEKERQTDGGNLAVDMENIAPPSAFNGALAASQPISEEPELALVSGVDGGDDGGDDDDEGQGDEESSISVSQRGVIVSQEVIARRKSKRRERRSARGVAGAEGGAEPASLSSSSPSSSSSPTLSSASALEGADKDEDGNRIEAHPYERQVNEEEERPQRITPVRGQQSASMNESESLPSATQAILDHLSLHHRDQLLGGASPSPVAAVELDEPAPVLEQSRSIDPQLRRESWRRESVRSATVAPIEEEGRENVAEQRGGPEETSSAPTSADAGERGPVEANNGTGTMKRKHVSGPDKQVDRPASEQNGASKSMELAGSEGADERRESSGQRQRGPPLSQLKAASENQAGGGYGVAMHQLQQPRQVSGSMATDTSICSSCSCLEASLDLSNQEAPKQAPVTASAPESQPRQPGAVASGAASTSSSSTRPAQQQRKGDWMSQEEGTVFTENYWLAHWLYISEHEESEIWRRAIDMGEPSAGQSRAPSGQPGQGDPAEEGLDKRGPQPQSPVAGMPKEMRETGDTGSERSFSSRYKSTTRKMIHRRATIEMYRRIMENKLRREKRVEISRSNGEFGFRIHGSRPVVVSAIERGTSAEICGLQVGDLIYAINGTNILDMAHSDVVRLAHSAESSALVLDLVPTNDFLRMSKYNRANNRRYEPTVTGFLMRLSPSTAQPLLIDLQEQMARLPGASSQQRAAKLNQVMRLAWRQRYFVLRSDNCLYWYKSPTDVEPFGGINLQGFSASLTNEFSEPSYVIRLIKYGGQPHYLGSNNMCDIQTWIDAINSAATEANQNDPYMKRTLMFARGRPSQIPEPDCAGYLYKFSHKRSGGAHWRAAFFILKDACLYLFRDQQAESVNQASAVYYLHGYKVRSKHIEHKRHTFELIPPNRKTIRPMFLMANNEVDKKRWIAALEYSIDRWIEID